MSKYVIFKDFDNVISESPYAVYSVYELTDTFVHWGSPLMIKNIDFDDMDHESERCFWGPLEAFCNHYLPRRKDEIMQKIAEHLQMPEDKKFLLI